MGQDTATAGNAAEVAVETRIDGDGKKSYKNYKAGALEEEDTVTSCPLMMASISVLPRW